MKTKNRIFYETPATIVVEMKQEGIVCASPGQAGMQNYTWRDMSDE